jgi:hypothetical protein
MKRELLAIAASAVISLGAVSALAADGIAPIQIGQGTLTPAQQVSVQAAVQSISAAIAGGNQQAIDGAVTAAVDTNPTLATTIIGIIAGQSPNSAATVAAAAATANPALAVAIFTAAANAAPGQTEAILAAVSAAVPDQAVALTAAGGQVALNTPPAPPPAPPPPPAPFAPPPVASPH